MIALTVTRRHRVVLGLLVVLAVAISLLGVFALNSSPYKDQLAGGGSDVSMTDAVKDHRIVLPDGADGARYWAKRAADGYPMDLRFGVNRVGVEEFARRNHLKETSFSDSFINDAYAFAQGQGVTSFSGARWFYRRPGRFGGSVEVAALPDGPSSYDVYVQSSE